MLSTGRLIDGHPDLTTSHDEALWASTDRDRLRRLAARGVDASNRAVTAVRDPDGARADGDPGRRLPDRDRRRHGSRARIDANDSVVESVDGPHFAGADRDRGRTVADRDRRQQSRRVNPRDRVGVAVRDPHRICPQCDGYWAGVRIDRLNDPARARVEPREKAGGRGNPHRVPERGCRARPTGHDVADLLDLRGDGGELRIDPPDAHRSTRRI